MEAFQASPASSYPTQPTAIVLAKNNTGPLVSEGKSQGSWVQWRLFCPRWATQDELGIQQSTATKAILINGFQVHHLENLRSDFMKRKKGFYKGVYYRKEFARTEAWAPVWQKPHPRKGYSEGLFLGLTSFTGLQHELAFHLSHPQGTPSFSIPLSGLEFLIHPQLFVSVLRKKTRKITRTQPMYWQS